MGTFVYGIKRKQNLGECDQISQQCYETKIAIPKNTIYLNKFYFWELTSRSIERGEV